MIISTCMKDQALDLPLKSPVMTSSYWMGHQVGMDFIETYPRVPKWKIIPSME